MSKLKPCGCHYLFRPHEPEFQIAIHLCAQHYADTMKAHNNHAARRWKWPTYAHKIEKWLHMTKKA